MHLSKAKTILIFAFLGLNFFLGYHLWFNPQTTVDGFPFIEEMERLEKELAEANLFLETALPRQVQRSSFLIVMPAYSDMLSLLDGKVLQEELLEGLRVLSGKNGILSVNRSGLITFEWAENNRPLKGVSLQDQAKVVEAIEEFLAEKNIKPKEAIFDFVWEVPHQERLAINYFQSYQGLPVYAGYLKIFVGGTGVEALEMFWLEPSGFQEGHEAEVITVATALRRLIEEIGPQAQGSCITDVSFGFYSRDYDAKKWEMPPVWRIRINERELYYINAFTGNLEEGSAKF